MIEEVGTFVEVHVDASVEACAERDVKGLYAKAFAGEIKEFTGVSDPYEAPDAPRAAGRHRGAQPGGERGAHPRQARPSSACVQDEVPGVSRRYFATDCYEVLIEPHGGSLVDRTGERPDDLESLETLTLTPREVSDLDMLASGALSPLEGFMGREDYERVVEDMHLANGLAWALPGLPRRRGGARRGPRRARRRGRPTAGRPRGRGGLRVRQGARGRALLPDDRRGASRSRAPLRAAPALPRRQASRSSSGPSPPFPELALDPADTRKAFEERGWRRVVGFQTRNPIHRAHEYLTKGALETVDGLLIHPLVGETKSDDVPAATRVECYRVLVDNYYPADRVIVSAFPAAMRYAGPREAIWHAICRKNFGCSHFIVGRDHAGVGDYYGTYDAQLIFDEFEPHELGIEPMFFEHAFWCNACGSMATPKTCPHGGDDHVFLSGTKVRELLAAGELPPVEFSRPEVAEVLIDAYR